MAIIFIIINQNTINIIIIDLYSFRINRENIDWTPNIIYLYCDEILDKYSENYDYSDDCFEYSENWEPMNMDN